MAQAYRYHRFSSKAQDKGSSIERQEAATQSMCVRHGWDIAETMEDKGRSAWKGDHLRVGELGKFKQRVDEGDVAPGSVLVIENLDRLSRQDVKRARRWIEEVTEAGIDVAVANQNKVFDEASLSGENVIDLLQYLLEAQRGNRESERKSDQLKAAWVRNREKAKTGHVITPRCPGWMKVVEGKFCIIEQNAEVVRQVYRWSAEGLGAYSIARKLNEAGVECWGRNNHKRERHWKHGYIRDVLKSPAVEGDYHPKTMEGPAPERIQGYYPRIVDAALVEEARSAATRRRGTGGSTRSEARNLFTGRVRCRHCSNSMVRQVQYNRQKKTYEYLKCMSWQNGTPCENKTLYRYDLFERAALTQMLHLAIDRSYFRKTDETAPLAVALAEAKKAIENREAEQQRLLGFIMRNPEAVEAEQMLNKMRPELAALRVQHDDIRSQLERARGTVTPDEHLQRVIEVRDAIYSDDLEVRDQARRKVRDAVQSVVQLVEVRKDDPETGDKTLTMILAGGFLAYKFDNKGKLLRKLSLNGTPQESGVQGTGGEQAMHDIKKRMRAIH